MDSVNADAAAGTLARAWRERDQIDELTESIRPADVMEAYDVQNRMIDAIPAMPVGWKVGASNENAMKRFGFNEPFYGRLLDSGMHVPLMTRFPKKLQYLAPGKPGTTTDRLVIFVDYPPTVLSPTGTLLP